MRHYDREFGLRMKVSGIMNLHKDTLDNSIPITTLVLFLGNNLYFKFVVLNK